ncbi:MAG: hypothetical protein JWN38_1200 [Candidatus Saccharibacteria bacterium]|nr:hypothetical protein [Candidatus Saccharibacteria bacterium]
MSIEEKLEADIKTAMIAHEATTVTTLRGLKAAFLSAKVAAGTRDSGLGDDEAIAILSKEAKKRQESADMYTQGNSPERAEAELAEKKLIETYLPAQLSDDEIAVIVDEIIASSTDPSMGPIIGAVKARTAGAADGGVIARIVKSKLLG